MIADLQVLPNTEMRVVNTRQFDDDDLASFVSGDGSKKTKAKETGFGDKLRNI